MSINELVEKSGKIEYTYQVTPDVYYSFQRCSNDFNPLHTDAEFAKSKGFNSCVMYGNILNAFISHFVGMLLPTREVMIFSQTINFRKPVFLSDEIKLESSVDSFSEMANIVDYKLKFRRLGGAKPELVASASVQIGILNDIKQ